MTRRRRPIVYAAAAWVMAVPAIALAHAFGERYDLPVPLGYFVAGAAVAVVLSFAVAAIVMRGSSRTVPGEGIVFRVGAMLPAARTACRTVSVGLLALVVYAGFAGTRNLEMNIAPTLVWLAWWVGLPLFAACIGNIWPALDPWRALFDGINALARHAGAARDISLGWTYPRTLGTWPAVALLLAFVWLEVVYPYAAMPSHIAWMALAWSALTMIGMTCFGADTWQRHADVFAVYFRTLGRFAPLGPGPDERTLVLRPPGRALVAGEADSFAMAAFVLAMLSTLLFDGLLGTQVIVLVHTALNIWMPSLVDSRGYFLGIVGMLGVWLFFLLAYLAACLATARLLRNRSTGAVARLFALTLVPIVVAYNVAHNFYYLLVQGQLLIPLASDPLGRGWNLFGTANQLPDIGIVDARLTWHVAIGAIVVGHVISIWLAHRVALREAGTPRRAVAASVPLTMLMVIYTVISLLVIAEPLVEFGDPTPPR